MRVVICRPKDGKDYGETLGEVELPEWPALGEEIMALNGEERAPRGVVRRRRWVAPLRKLGRGTVEEAYMVVSVREDLPVTHSQDTVNANPDNRSVMLDMIEEKEAEITPLGDPPAPEPMPALEGNQIMGGPVNQIMGGPVEAEPTPEVAPTPIRRKR